MAPCSASHAAASEGPDVDRVPGHVRGRVRGGHPSGSFLFGAVLGDRLTKKLTLVLRGTPAAIDEELEPVVRGIRCSLAQGTQESWIEVGDTRNLVIKDRRAVWDGTVGLAKRATMLTAKGEGSVRLAERNGMLIAKHVDGPCDRRGRGRQRLARKGSDDRGDDDE